MTADPIQVADAETAVLGAVLSGYGDIDALADLLDPSDFYQPFHEEVWAAILRVHGAGNKPEPTSVRLALTAASVKHDPLRLVELAGIPYVGDPGYYARLVSAASGSRRIQAAGVKVAQLAGTLTDPDDLDEMREQARQAIDEATRGHSISKARTMADLIPSVIDLAQHGQTSVLATPWPDLDRLIGGLAPGRLIVVGARPGGGKSLMGTNLALHFAHIHGHAVLISSMEMPEDEVGQRLLAAHARVNLTGLQMGNIDEAAWSRVAAKTAELQALPITVDDAPTQTVTAIRRAARDMQRTRDDLALIVVDYLQLIATPGKDRNRAEALGEVSRGLKILARETGACVVAMAQVNREAVKHGDGKPKMSDLRESGSIEADADQVLLLHQPPEKDGEVEVIVDKNRHGPKGFCMLQMQGHYARLGSVQWSPSRAAGGA